MLILVEDLRPFAPMQLDRRNLILEFSRFLRCRKALLRALRPAILRLPRNLARFNKVLRMPPRMLARERIVEAIPEYTVVDLRIA